MLYLDTSVLVGALTPETATPRLQAWLAEQRPGELCISQWVVTEFSSALSIKLRTGQINPDHRAAALALFSKMRAETLTVEAISAVHFETAARFADLYALGIRAGDGLHLAITQQIGAALCTLDKKLADAGAVLGVKVNLI